MTTLPSFRLRKDPEVDDLTVTGKFTAREAAIAGNISASIVQTDTIATNVENVITIIAPSIVVQASFTGHVEIVSGDNSGVTIPSSPIPWTFIISSGGTMDFALNPPVTPLNGSVIHVINKSGHNTTGLVTSNGGGGIFAYDSISQDYVKIAGI